MSLFGSKFSRNPLSESKIFWPISAVFLRCSVEEGPRTCRHSGLFEQGGPFALRCKIDTLLYAYRGKSKPSPPSSEASLFQRHPRGHAPSPLHRHISHAPLTAARHCPPPPAFLPPTSRPRAGGLPTTTTTCRRGRSPPLVGAHPRADVSAVACRRHCSYLRRLS